MTNKILKLSRSLSKLILPTLYKILIRLKLNRRVINFLSEKSYKSNEKYNFSELIENLLDKKKIIALDVGAQGGFNSDNFFPIKYNFFFDKILVEPIESEAKKFDGIDKLFKGIMAKTQKDRNVIRACHADKRFETLEKLWICFNTCCRR